MTKSKQSNRPKLYAWGDRELTIPQWVLEADIWLRGIDEEILRVRLEGPCVGEPWSVERSLTTPVANDEALLRAEDLVPKAQGRSKDARELNAVRKSLLRLVAVGGVVPERTYRTALALASDRHKPPPPAIVPPNVYTREEMEAAVNLAIDEAPLLREGYRNTSVARIIQNTITRLRELPPLPPPVASQAQEVAWHTFEVKEYSAVRGIRTKMRFWTFTDRPTAKPTPQDSAVFAGTNSGGRFLVVGDTKLDAEAFPVGTRRTVVTSQHFVVGPHVLEETPS